MTGTPRARAVLDFDTLAKPTAGIFHREGELPRPFHGWVELLSALETMIASFTPHPEK